MLRTFGTKNGFGSPKKPLNQVLRNIFSAVKTPIQKIQNVAGQIGSTVNHASESSNPYISGAANIVKNNEIYKDLQHGIQAGGDIANNFINTSDKFLQTSQAHGGAKLGDVANYGKELINNIQDNDIRNTLGDVANVSTSGYNLGRNIYSDIKNKQVTGKKLVNYAGQLYNTANLGKRVIGDVGTVAAKKFKEFLD